MQLCILRLQLGVLALRLLRQLLFRLEILVQLLELILKTLHACLLKPCGRILEDPRRRRIALSNAVQLKHAMLKAFAGSQAQAPQVKEIQVGKMWYNHARVIHSFVVMNVSRADVAVAPCFVAIVFCCTHLSNARTSVLIGRCASSCTRWPGASSRGTAGGRAL
eukprot:1187077-Prorocentrum_minimum.AAC.6